MEVADYTRPGFKKRLLRYIWPDTSHLFDEVFSSYIKEREQVDDGYRRGKYSIEIFLTDDQSRRHRQDSDQSCPSTPYMSANSPGGASALSSVAMSPSSSVMSPPAPTPAEAADQMLDFARISFTSPPPAPTSAEAVDQMLDIPGISFNDLPEIYPVPTPPPTRQTAQVLPQPMNTYQVEVSDSDIAYMMSANPVTDFPDLNNANYELALDEDNDIILQPR